MFVLIRNIHLLKPTFVLVVLQNILQLSTSVKQFLVLQLRAEFMQINWLVFTHLKAGQIQGDSYLLLNVHKIVASTFWVQCSHNSGSELAVKSSLQVENWAVA